jgi:hypothetical protein
MDRFQVIFRLLPDRKHGLKRSPVVFTAMVQLKESIIGPATDLLGPQELPLLLLVGI